MARPPSAPDDLVTLGHIVGLFGVRGWVKVYSYTRPPQAILNYKRWRVRLSSGWRQLEVKEGRTHGKGLVVRLAGYVDRGQAAALVGADVAFALAELPALEPGEYYWAELEGREVVNLQGVVLGKVSHLFETGANDVMVVVGERERLIPFIRDVIRRIDLGAGRITVDWDADF
jgi:16S rRNA processing protein RimM